MSEQRTGRKAGMFFVAVLLLLFLCGNGRAAGGKTLRAGCPSRCEETVVARTGKDGIILSLPGFWDLTAVTLELPGSDKVILGKGNREIDSGTPTDVTDLIGKKTELRDGKGILIGKLTILQGSVIPALFIEVTEKN